MKKTNDRVLTEHGEDGGSLSDEGGRGVGGVVGGETTGEVGVPVPALHAHQLQLVDGHAHSLGRRPRCVYLSPVENPREAGHSCCPCVWEGRRQSIL